MRGRPRKRTPAGLEFRSDRNVVRGWVRRAGLGRQRDLPARDARARSRGRLAVVIDGAEGVRRVLENLNVVCGRHCRGEATGVAFERREAVGQARCALGEAADSGWATGWDGTQGAGVVRLGEAGDLAGAQPDGAGKERFDGL